MKWKQIKEEYNDWNFCVDNYRKSPDGFRIKLSPRSMHAPGDNLQDYAGINDSTTIYSECIIGRHVSIGECVDIGKKCIISEYTVIATNATIGNHVHIGKHAYLRESIGVESNVIIGDRVIIGCDTRLLEGCKIEDNAKIGSMCDIHRNAIIKNSLTHINGSKHTCFIADPANGQIGIGCHYLTKNEWIERFNSILNGEIPPHIGYSMEAIAEYYRYIILLDIEIKSQQARSHGNEYIDSLIKDARHATNRSIYHKSQGTTWRKNYENAVANIIK